MKTRQTSIPFQSIDAAQLEAVLGGCGCGQTNCNSANCSGGQAPTNPATLATQRRLPWGR